MKTTSESATNKRGAGAHFFNDQMNFAPIGPGMNGSLSAITAERGRTLQPDHNFLFSGIEPTLSPNSRPQSVQMR